MQDIVDAQMTDLRSVDIERDADVEKYIELLPAGDSRKTIFDQIKSEKVASQKAHLIDVLRGMLQPGEIMVNIMSKVDHLREGQMVSSWKNTLSDACTALRGFVRSKLRSAVVLSAGLNPRLYSYLADFPEFIPDSQSQFEKRIVLKVSDYRSALIQAKFLAKKGVWVSEYRVESGLNCGGHAFATDGYLLGPILEEFKQQRDALSTDIFPVYRKALLDKGVEISACPAVKVTAQGGVGTAEEHRFLLDYYQLDGIGWGSPFLLVPEATTVDRQTLEAMLTASSEDFMSVAHRHWVSVQQFSEEFC